MGSEREALRRKICRGDAPGTIRRATPPREPFRASQGERSLTGTAAARTKEAQSRVSNLYSNQTKKHSGRRVTFMMETDGSGGVREGRARGAQTVFFNLYSLFQSVLTV